MYILLICIADRFGLYVRILGSCVTDRLGFRLYW